MNHCLGIFDSGMGGFSVLRAICKRHGDIPCVYLADTARIPFGDKSPSDIRSIAAELVSWLRGQNVSLFLVACNTTNSVALDIVEDLAGVPVLGLIQSAALMINESRIGVLATPATAASKAYSHHIKSIRPDAYVIEKACPDFVPLIESGKLYSKEIERVASLYITPLLQARVESIVLGCSHYPFLEPILRNLLPSNIRIIDPAIGLARELDKYLGSPKDSSEIPCSYGNTRLCVTAEPKSFFERSKALLVNCPEVELISLRPKACFF